MTRVVVVDDSAFMRHALSRVLSAPPDIEVIGQATDGIEALELVRRLRPDVVTLDVEMPRMDGLRALATIMRDMPLPVVMLSSLTAEGTPATIQALELGAVDFVTKPASPALGIGSIEARLIAIVRQASRARVQRHRPGEAVAYPAAGVRAGAKARPSGTRPAHRLVAIGCSTGGPRALLEVIPRLPANLPAAVLIVQHMPAGFTRSLAERLDQGSALSVKEAEAGDLPLTGTVLLAPGGRHMTLEKTGRVALHDGPSVHGVRPSVDVLFASLPAVCGARCVAAVLTGMGSDGADGVAAIRTAGGQIVAEDASTAVVYGMPRAVAERGLAHHQLPLGRIAAVLTDLVLYPHGATPTAHRTTASAR